MTKKVQKKIDEKNSRFTVKCFKCKPTKKWDADLFDVCTTCGNVELYADDHRKATSRKYINGVEVDR